MARYRGIKIEGTVLSRDDTATELAWFDEATLHRVTEIAAECFGLSSDESAQIEFDARMTDAGCPPAFREHHEVTGPSTIDLSLLTRCRTIGERFAVGHYGPVVLPPALETVGDNFMLGAKTRVLELPVTVKTIGAHFLSHSIATAVHLPPTIQALPPACFVGARMTTIEIPSSVTSVADSFGSKAEFGTVQFAPSERDVSIGEAFLSLAIVGTVELPLSFKAATTDTDGAGAEAAFDHEKGKVEAFSCAELSTLRYAGITPLSEMLEPPPQVLVGTVVLKDVRDAALFPDAVFVLDAPLDIQPVLARISTKLEAQSPTEPSSPVEKPKMRKDLASLTTFEVKHVPFVLNDSCIDMSDLVKCHTIGNKVFEGVTNIDRIDFPPNLKTIGKSFMSGADCPELWIKFPPSLQKIGGRAFGKSKLRSISFRPCATMTALPDELLNGASVLGLELPPRLETIGGMFLEGADCPGLSLSAPDSLCELGWSAFHKCTIEAIDLRRTGLKKLNGFAFSSFDIIMFPDNLESVGDEFMEGIDCPEVDLSFPESLKKIGKKMLKKARVGGVGFINGSAVTALPSGFLEGASIENDLDIPSDVETIGDGAMSALTCDSFRFVASRRLKTIGDRVLCNATIGSAEIIDCPKLNSVGFHFMARATFQIPVTLVFPDVFEAADYQFCAETTLRVLDLHRCVNLRRLPVKFLHKARIVTDETTTSAQDGGGSDGRAQKQSPGIRLPPSVAVFGDHCFAESKGIACIPAMEETPIISVGDFFGVASEITEVQWTRCLVKVGRSFFKDAPTLTLDARVLHTVGEHFCAGVKQLSVEFDKAPLAQIGAGFLQGATLCKAVDLSRSTFTQCPDCFLYKATFCSAGSGGVTLPACVAVIGGRCCAEVTALAAFSISASLGQATAPATSLVMHDFLRGCASLQAVVLPDSVSSFGHNCFADCPALSVVLELQNTTDIGDNFLAKTDLVHIAELSGGADDQDLSRGDIKGNTASHQSRQSHAALRNLRPDVIIGDNFAAHAHLSVLSFTDHRTAAFDSSSSLAIAHDPVFKTIRDALSNVGDSPKDAAQLRELMSLRIMVMERLRQMYPCFRGIFDELVAVLAAAEPNLEPGDRRVAVLAKELCLEEDHLFQGLVSHHDVDDNDGTSFVASMDADVKTLLAQLPEKQRILNARSLPHEGPDARSHSTAKENVVGSIGHNFLAHTTGLVNLDMSSALHTSIGDRFAADSGIHEVKLPLTVTSVGRDLCAGCLATISAIPFGNGKEDCYLSTVMAIRIDKERIDTLIHFRGLLPASQWPDLARWLLEEKYFAEFKAVFNVREDGTGLQHVGGTVDDLPEVPADVPQWPDFVFDVAPHDTSLSLLHWAVKYSRQFTHLLNEAPWSLRDLTLVTKQGFTALHYAVLYNIEVSALKTLLNIAAKAEIHRAWREARSAGGVHVSPLHLAYLYRRDWIVKELLAFEWDPTEAVEENARNEDWEESFVFDAYDQSLVELGHARRLQEAHAQAEATSEPGPRLPVAVRLFHTAVIVCIRDHLQGAAWRSQPFTHGMHQAYVFLKHKMSIDAPALSQNKWSEARQQLQHVAALGSQRETQAALCVGIKPGAVIAAGSSAHGKLSSDEFLQSALTAALSDPDHSADVRVQYRQLLTSVASLTEFALSEIASDEEAARCFDAGKDKDKPPPLTFIAAQSVAIQERFRGIQHSPQGHAAPQTTTETLLLRTQSMEGGPHQDKVEEKLANVIPFRFVVPVLPFFYLMLLIVFGLSWFFHPPILAPTLMGVENAIVDCTNPYNTNDATADGVIPWDCSVGFTELGMQVETFPNQVDASATSTPSPASFKTAAATTKVMNSFFSFIKKENIPRNVTHLPWAYLRFATVVRYNGMKKDAGSIADAEAAPTKAAQEYWVLTELEKLPDWAPEIFEQKNTKVNESTISFKGETTRTFSHTVVPYQFGNHTLLGCWITGVMVLLIACVGASLYHAHTFSLILRESEVRLVEVSTVQRSVRGMLLACEAAAIMFTAVGVSQMAITFDHHKNDEMITRATAGQWQRIEIFFRVGLTFCSFRAVSFFSEMPKPHHFAMVNATVVGVGLIATLVGLLLMPAARVGLAASLKSLLSIQAVDALTLPAVLGVALFFRSSKVTDEVRQAHHDNLCEDIGDLEMEAAAMATTNAAADLSPLQPALDAEPVEDSASNIDTDPDDESEMAESQKAENEKAGSGMRSAALNRSGDERTPDDSTPVYQFADSVPLSSHNGRSQNHRKNANGNGDAVVNISDESPSARLLSKPSASMEIDELWSEASHASHESQRVDGNGGKATEKARLWIAEASREARLARARRRFFLNWTVVMAAGLGQVLLYALAVTVVLRPLLTLPSPGGVLPITGDTFLSSDDVGVMGVARKFFF